jgi:hypothetical protein
MVSGKSEPGSPFDDLELESSRLRVRPCADLSERDVVNLELRQTQRSGPISHVGEQRVARLLADGHAVDEGDLAIPLDRLSHAHLPRLGRQICAGYRDLALCQQRRHFVEVEFRAMLHPKGQDREIDQRPKNDQRSGGRCR